MEADQQLFCVFSFLESALRPILGIERIAEEPGACHSRWAGGYLPRITTRLDCSNSGRRIQGFQDLVATEGLQEVMMEIGAHLRSCLTQDLLTIMKLYDRLRRGCFGVSRYYTSSSWRSLICSKARKSDPKFERSIASPRGWSTIRVYEPPPQPFRPPKSNPGSLNSKGLGGSHLKQVLGGRLIK
jgi:hypothetical protein